MSSTEQNYLSLFAMRYPVVRSSTKDRKELFDMTPQYKQTLNVYNAYVHYIAENF